MAFPAVILSCVTHRHMAAWLLSRLVVLYAEGFFSKNQPRRVPETAISVAIS